jgi:hypothetical protein
MKKDREQWFLLGVMVGFAAFLLLAIMMESSKEDPPVKKAPCNEYYITAPSHGPER